jgi:uncharacterized protein (DUF302 family)
MIASSRGFSTEIKLSENPADTLVISEKVIKVKHVTVIVHSTYDQFTKQLEGLIGRYDVSVMVNIEKDPKLVAKQLEAMEGEQGLMLFGVQEHGKLLNIAGAPRKAKQYLIGNPIIASQMTRHDIRAGLYAPLRVLVFEDYDKQVHVEYDLPSTLFGQFGNPAVTKVGNALDAKLLIVIKKADK